MKRIRWSGVMAALCAGAVLAVPVRGQSVAEVVNDIDHARVVTRVLYVTAHPDDERSSVLTYLSKGLGDDVALCSTTRGEGGQNAIGPELGPALKILRTSELYRATQDYGAELFFTRAPDFGYSKSPEETLRIWHGIAKEDLTRVIRTFRPDIVINQWGGVHSGHGQHQATGIITPEAVAAAADPTAYPEQLQQGLRVWRVGRVMQYARNSEHQADVIEMRVGEISPLWGRSYAGLGLEGFANHRSQGITRVLDSAFFSRPVYLTVVQGPALAKGDWAQPLAALASGSQELQHPLDSADSALAAARAAALGLNWPEAVKQLANAGRDLDRAIEEAKKTPDAHADALWALERQKRKLDTAIAGAAALQINAESDRSALVAGESFSVRVNWNDRRDAGVELEKPELILPAGWSAASEKPKENSRTNMFEQTPAPGALFRVSVPANATSPQSPQDAILPWRPPLVRLAMKGTAGGYAFSIEKPVIARDYTSTEVETMPLELVPAVTLSVDPDQVMLPVERPSRSFSLLLRVRYHGASPAQVSVGADVPRGWEVNSAAPLEFSGAGDRLVRFTVTPPANTAESAYDLKPYAKIGDAVFRTSYEVLPSLPSRHVSQPALATAHVLDLKFPPHLRVGYIAAGIDPVPQSLRQLGVQVEMLDEAALAFDDLDRYDAIVVGIRAYELRPDVMNANRRLLDYVQRGGTLLVQYERDFAWNKLMPAPFPADMHPAERITDENSPVRFVDPSSPLLHFPNRITQEDFNGWIQERGLYFWSKWAPEYHPVLAMHDPGEPDALGGLVVARDGKGVYIYTGLAFFRQLPAGVPGAYRLFINLLSASQSAASR